MTLAFPSGMAASVFPRGIRDKGMFWRPQKVEIDGSLELFCVDFRGAVPDPGRRLSGFVACMQVLHWTRGPARLGHMAPAVGPRGARPVTAAPGGSRSPAHRASDELAPAPATGAMSTSSSRRDWKTNTLKLNNTAVDLQPSIKYFRPHPPPPPPPCPCLADDGLLRRLAAIGPTC